MNRIALCSATLAAALLAAIAWSADPASGTLTPANDAAHPLTFTTGVGGPNFSNGFGLLPTSCDDRNPCDAFELTVDLPADYSRTDPDAHLRIRLEGAGAAGNDFLATNAAGAIYARAESAGADAKEIWLRARHGKRVLHLVTVSATGTAEGLTGKVTIEPLPPNPRNDALPYAAHEPAPGFEIHTPDQQGLGLFGGEATIGVNWKTGSAFYIAFLETLRVRFDDSTTPATSTWENKSGTLNSIFSSDPILVEDPATGRIWAQQLIAGIGQSFSEYSDDDGETWLPGGQGGQRSGADHQSLGVGPYPAEGLGAAIPHPLYPNALYYCSQDVITAYCSRSDDGGVTFGPGVPLYAVNQCAGLHGHPKIAPDGTVYVPNRSCMPSIPVAGVGQPALVVSEDAGNTWSIRPVPDGVGALFSLDPSVAVAKDGTVYFSWIDGATRHLHVAVSKDRGLTWINSFDVGAIAGVRWSKFPAAVAGDADRAAVAFFGSRFAGYGEPGVGELPGLGASANSSVADSMTFPGLWNLYVATTYDGGATWAVESVGDPMQGAGGIGSGDNRNLYDFFDVTVDPAGRILVSYEDGCAGGCLEGGSSTFQDFAVIARQSSGKRLFAEFDPPAAAKAGAKPAPTKRLPRDNLDQPELACSLPGVTVPDRVGETEAQPPHRDIASFSIAEPQDLPGKLVFTIQPALALPPIQGGAYFFLTFDMPNGGARYRLRVSGEGNEFGYFDGAYTEEPGTGAQNLALNPDPARQPDPETGVGADGTIWFILDKATWGLATGDRLSAIIASSLPGPSGLNVTTDEAGYDYSYTLVGNDYCSKNGISAPPNALTPPAVMPPVAEAAFGAGGAFGKLLLLGLLAALGLRRVHRRR